MQRQGTRIFSFLVVLLATSFGCELFSNQADEIVCSTDPVPGFIQPLEVGNFWTFEATGPSGEFRKMITQSVVDSLEFEIEGREIRAYHTRWDFWDDDAGDWLYSNTSSVL